MVIDQNLIVETPGWNPDSQSTVGGNDLVLDRKIIRISGLTVDDILLIKLDGAICVKVTVIGILADGISIFSDGSNQPGNIWRTAGAGVPGWALRFVMQMGCDNTGNSRKHFQGIYIEEAFAV